MSRQQPGRQVRRSSTEGVYHTPSPSPIFGDPSLPRGERSHTVSGRRMQVQQNRVPLDDFESPRPVSSGSDEGYVPSPPPRPPSTQRVRPMSSRQRPKSSRITQPLPLEEDLPNVTVMRPPSSFNKFSRLPSIGDPNVQQDEPASLHADLDDLHLSETRVSKSQSTRQPSGMTVDNSDKPETQKDQNDPASIPFQPLSGLNLTPPEHPLPPEPTEQEERLLLAVKLPADGKRCQRYFSPSDYLQDIHHFAENMSQQNLSQYVLACNAPRKVFSSLTVQIHDVDLLDKTVLYFEEK
ncbi:UBX domain-containing protein 10-like [Haliotis rubra]|uniref:UBX domain-containing protein 10-like n=1 Tax=Haliotis rubra TaxID=36100 RepID=UPI001EE62D4A|nr:UBX domain-containing protein 10-like [Haliotis rubra]